MLVIQLIPPLLPFAGQPRFLARIGLFCAGGVAGLSDAFVRIAVSDHCLDRHGIGKGILLSPGVGEMNRSPTPFGVNRTLSYRVTLREASTLSRRPLAATRVSHQLASTASLVVATAGGFTAFQLSVDTLFSRISPARLLGFEGV